MRNLLLALIFGILIGAGGTYVLLESGGLESQIFAPFNSNSLVKISEASAQPVFSPDAEEFFVSQIDSAQKTIDVEMYTFSNKNLISALERAKERGVKVRLILESRIDSTTNIATMKTLKADGIEARWATITYKLTHAKLMIIDGKKVIVGSHNWSKAAMTANREASVYIESEKLAQEFLGEFEKDWELGTPN
ncbi:Cardiolipin synthase B [Candidatus Gugararchaeum adminiculabundum]|nr:Cardiolipin synthase B [Candidatus Gugararchaeum adminiculabundum]